LEGKNMESYLLLECSSGMVWKVAEEIIEIKGIKMAHAVTGNYDVIAYVEFSNIDELTSIIQKVQVIKGVQKTQTAVAMPEKSI
jgi:DNA-binding Lrp family transcriptional regulator